MFKEFNRHLKTVLVLYQVLFDGSSFLQAYIKLISSSFAQFQTMLLIYKRMCNNFETLKLLLNNINRLYDWKKKRSAFTISSVVPEAGAGCLQPCSILLHDDAVY